MNIMSGAPSCNPFAKTVKVKAVSNLSGTTQLEDGEDAQNMMGNQDDGADVDNNHRVSLLEETFVVKHINESAITKDHESFSLVESSINDENYLHRPTVDTHEQIMNMFDASKMDNSSVHKSRQNTVGTGAGCIKQDSSSCSFIMNNPL